MMSNLPEFAPLQKGQPSNVEHKQQMDTIMEELKVLNNKVRALFVSVLVGIVVLIIVIAVLFVNFNNELKNHSHAPKVGETISKMLNRENEELCVPCDNLRLGPSIEEDRFLDKLTRKDDPKGEQCCVESPKQLLDMLNLFIERRYREEMAKAISAVRNNALRGNIKLSNEDSPGDKENVPAAHMMGSIKSNVPSRVPGKQITIGEWIYNRDLGFIQRAKYRHGRIVIPSTGVYFIYSQVSFLEVVDIKQGNSKPPSTTSPSLSHYLYRYNLIYPHGGEETLIQNSITKCWGHNKSFGEYTSYLGAVFQLRQGDEIFVKVSNLTLLTSDPKSNYFGLFKIN